MRNLFDNLAQAFRGELSLPRTFWNYYQIPLIVVSVGAILLAMSFVESFNPIYLVLSVVAYLIAVVFAFGLGLGVFRAAKAEKRYGFWAVLARVGVVLNMIQLPLFVIGVYLGVLDTFEHRAQQRAVTVAPPTLAKILALNSIDSQVLFFGDKIRYIREIDPAFDQPVEEAELFAEQREDVCRSFAGDFESGKYRIVEIGYVFDDHEIELVITPADCN